MNPNRLASPTAFRVLALLALASVIGFAPRALAQGTFYFRSTVLPKPRILLPDGAPIAGSNFGVDVRVRNPATGQFEGGLTRTNGTAFESVNPFTGANAGLFSGGILIVPFLPPGATATLRVRAWDRTLGKTFEESTVRGASEITVPLGGVKQADGTTSSPTEIVPQYLGFNLSYVVPPYVEVPAQIRFLSGEVILAWKHQPGPAYYWIAFSPEPAGVSPITYQGRLGDLGMWYQPAILLNTTPGQTPDGLMYYRVNTAGYPSGFFRVLKEN